MDDQQLDWDHALGEAAEAAHHALVRARPFADEAELLLRYFADELNPSAFPGLMRAPEAVRTTLAAFEERSENLRGELNTLTGDVSRQLSAGFEALGRDVRFTTIMLFGRTRAGKSTTMEALTRGNGASIGTGSQHTTTETTAYYYPPPPDGQEEPNGPALRIVDTPGIEGFDGEALGAMAEAFVERADHVLFLVSDDKVSADELRRFGLIQTQGKGVTVVLNVKKTDVDLDFLAEAPEYVFDPVEIDGHQRRISGFLADHFGMEPPPVIPVHARAAWLARRPDRLPEDYSGTFRPDALPALEVPSGITDLERRLHAFVRRDALAARLRSPIDLLHAYIETVRAELQPYVQTFRDDQRAIRALGETMGEAVATAGTRSRGATASFRGVYDLASAEVEGFVDDLVVSRTDQTFSERWQRFLSDQGLLDLGTGFQSATTARFSEEVAEGIRVAAFDAAHLPEAGDAENLLEDYHADADANQKRGYGRAAVKAAGGVGAGALATWAVANWWNPTGWVAAIGAAAVVIAGGAAGTHVATEVTDQWSRADRIRFAKRRAELAGTLRKSLHDGHRALVRDCEQWLDRTCAAYHDATTNVLRPVADSAGALRSRTLGLLRELDGLGDRIDLDAVASLLALVCPEAASGEIRVVRVARSPGVACVVQIESGLDNVLGRCIGAGGSRVQALSHYLSGERVVFVDAGAPFDIRVRQALGLRITPRLAAPGAGGGPLRVLVPPDHIGHAIGRDGVTVRLAARLLDTPILIDAD